jgi:putative transposase
MTDERMALIELIEKGADADLIRDMLAFAAERLMSLEVEALTGAPAGVRSPERLTHRRYHDVRGGGSAALGGGHGSNSGFGDSSGSGRN